MRKFVICSLFCLAPLALTVSGRPAQQSPSANVQSADAQIRERVKTFYQDILKNDRVAALDFVATASKNQFLNNRYEGLSDFRISSVTLAPEGSKATVKVIRVTHVATFSQPLEIDVLDTWQLVNGQWYFVLPPPGEIDTPFGKMKFDPNNKPNDAETQAMKQRIDRAYQNVDPDQYIQALQKVAPPSDAGAVTPGQAPQAGAAAGSSKHDNSQQQAKPAPPAPAPSNSSSTSKPPQ